MRKVILLVACLLALSMAITVYAHPGGTDYKGGHTNHNTGEYHYHHGYSAHDHYDIDGDGEEDCPHDFRDNTVHSESIDVQNPKKKQTFKQDLSDFLGKLFAFGVASGLILMFLAQFVAMFNEDIAVSLISIGFRILFLTIPILIINLFLLFLI